MTEYSFYRPSDDDFTPKILNEVQGIIRTSQDNEEALRQLREKFSDCLFICSPNEEDIYIAIKH